MIELDVVRIARNEILELRRQDGGLRVRIRIPWEELPHFVLLPEQFTLRWEHLDDGGLPVHLRSWSCRPCGSAAGLMLLELCLGLRHDNRRARDERRMTAIKVS